ncbi:hypothetical protein [Streptomyces sp. NPDC057694]|uniref:hypothetical protein n=1 Tax=Streptomyces sp. NPDC057694 TaxID=3346216 RepID=UPI0036D07E95
MADPDGVEGVGVGVAQLHDCAGAHHQHPDLVYRPVTDTPRSELVVAWAQDDSRRQAASFVDAAVEPAEKQEKQV